MHRGINREIVEAWKCFKMGSTLSGGSRSRYNIYYADVDEGKGDVVLKRRGGVWLVPGVVWQARKVLKQKTTSGRSLVRP